MSRSRNSRRNGDEEEEEENGGNSDDNHLDLFFSHVLEDPAGKHDYDWLLTPPGTPSSNSTSTSKLSISSQSDNINHNHSRSSRTNNNAYSSSILNTSSSSFHSSRPSSRPIVPPHTPPNLRTTLPNRPLSAARSRPTLKTHCQTQPSSATNISRRHSSPVVNTPLYANSNAHHAHQLKSPSTTTTTVTDNTAGFGRTISNKSKHMDIRNSSGNPRALSNTTLFPQSIRTSTTPTPKTQSRRLSTAPPSISNNRFHVGKRNMMINGREVIDERQHNSAKLSQVVDIYESSRYDTLLLKEDLKNTDWLHSADDKCDQDSIFGNGFEHLPEPFGLL
ncbi:hypothetical protein Lal_00037012 [Lupinus albus]|uniref:Uncharacterized protein n=1 Tax=Lupinus albus TaxID=3870 RepID=A0A6A4R9Z0_LUPAL|nr:hypothetical protein Lalb_Chr01g0023911 [Lupinus albus]KAF1897569.1 hypothetical protein Lal_00037012 [Lupinus albus]